jgi:hypothetical protein
MCVDGPPACKDFWCGDSALRFLLSRGADPDRKNVFGEAQRKDLERSGDPEIIAALRARKR